MSEKVEPEKDKKQIKEYSLDDEVLSLLLTDKSSNQNILWCTDTYEKKGPKYASDQHITLDLINGKNVNIIKPRVEKSKTERENRIRNKAEVFTPSWVCNKQNNLIDNQWFGCNNTFNEETENGWKTNNNKIDFPKGKSWKDYILLNRLEITCGEAPYLVSRYDTVSGEYIDVKDRIGLLDRKLRVVSENTASEEEWYEYALKAVKSIYGYDWQGDNVFLARRNVLFTFMDFYSDKFDKDLSQEKILEVANVIVWNIWQMDGMKFVIPNSCHEEEEPSLFGDGDIVECPGCKNENNYAHNGTYCYIMEWDKNKKTRFVDSVKKGY